MSGLHRKRKQLRRLKIRNITLNTVCILLAFGGISWTVNYFWKYVNYEITNDAVVDQYITPRQYPRTGLHQGSPFHRAPAGKGRRHPSDPRRPGIPYQAERCRSRPPRCPGLQRHTKFRHRNLPGEYQRRRPISPRRKPASGNSNRTIDVMPTSWPKSPSRNSNTNRSRLNTKP